MGRLSLPVSGKVYVDAQIVIYATLNHPQYGAVCVPLWQIAGNFDVVTSDLTLLETLVSPLRDGDTALAAKREGLWNQPNTRRIPISETILREAAQLCAIIPGLKTPDAIHAATALVYGCVMFITNDIGFRRVPNLPLVLLDDVLTAL